MRRRPFGWRCGAQNWFRTQQERRCLSISACITSAASLLPLPAAPLVGLPIGQLEAACLAIGPGAPRSGQRLVVVTIENQHHPLITLAISRQRRVVDQE